MRRKEAKARSSGPVAPQAAASIAGLGGAFLLFCAEAGASCPAFDPGAIQGNLGYGGLTELSGLAASRRHPGVLWAHNDSGDAARLYALRADGAHLGVYNIPGASAVDWEDIAIGPGAPAAPNDIYIGDIGDNNASRPSIVVYRVPEPEVAHDQTPDVFTIDSFEALPMQYPGGARYDAEALLADSVSGDIFIVTKNAGGTSRVFRCSAPIQAGVLRTLEEVGVLVFGTPALPSADRVVTAGDIAPSGREILLRTYSSAHFWARSAGETVSAALAGPACTVPLRVDFLWPQGEAIAFAGDGFDYYTVSEGAGAPMIRYDRERPVRIVGIRLPPGTGLSFDVEAKDASADDLGVDSALDPDGSAGWGSETGVTVESLGQGLFRLAVPTIVGTQRFYRVSYTR